MAMATGSAVHIGSVPCHEGSSGPSLVKSIDGRTRVLRRTPSVLLSSSSVAAARPRQKSNFGVYCSVGEGTSSSVSTSEIQDEQDGESWVPVIPLTALPKGERRLVRQDGLDVLLLWYKGEILAIENTSPAEGAYSEGFVNAKLTQDGCIVCPSTDSTFDLKTGEIKEWFPSNPVLRVLTPPLRKLVTYPVKVDPEYIYINMVSSGDAAEIVFGGQTQAGKSASSVEVEEVRMVVDEEEMGFGFTLENELINGRSAMLGFTVLLIFELLTGKGFLKGIGFLDFLYRYLPNFPILRY
ncbi:hypothetical protein KP509_16G079700 [Ceratopteris richardii]|uniref:Rieske domain-containing protein n=1 Tax=Ceratopteris richardii TaxID=49495 RepID=A0A8T2T092_CERRI|nr:hypothetical protein KP509_16G079700 [Ceratopteris richardii]